MAKAKRKPRKSGKTKKDLESKIAALETKLSKLSGKIPPPPPKAEAKAPPPPPKAEAKAPPPPPKAEAKTPPPKPSEAAPPEKPVWLQWQDSPMGDWNVQKAKTPGYVSAPNRYYASKVVLDADVPSYDWNLQKEKVPGFTAPSNKYFATRARMAYHPHDKSFRGYGIQTSVTTSGQTQTAPPPPPPKPDATLPKGSGGSTSGKSKKQQLEDYEKDYFVRLDKQQAEDAAAAAEAAKAQTSSTHGSLPKGF